MYVIREERTAIGVTRAMKSAAMGEETATAKKEKATVTLIQIVRALWFVGGTTATGGMETTAARDIKMLGVCVCVQY